MASCVPVVVFAYNRARHLERTLSCLNQSTKASDSELFIFCDGAKDDSSALEVVKTREVAKKTKLTQSFKNVEVIVSDENKGLSNSVIDGVSAVVGSYDRVVVLEDDLETTPPFLDYMNKALNRYQLDERIWSISGYTPPLSAISTESFDVYFAQRGCSWGWGTWKDRWVLVDWDVGLYESFKHDRNARRSFARWGRDLPVMLDAQMYHRIDSWAVRWCFEEFTRNMYTVYPTRSLVGNIGMDGSGTHGRATDSFDVDLDYAIRDYQFVDLYFDEEIRREFSAQYSGSHISVLGRALKWSLVRAGLISP